MSDKERVQFDFSSDALARLDSVKEKMEAATRAEVIRNALKVYEFLVEAGDESTIVVTRPDGEVILMTKISLLLR